MAEDVDDLLDDSEKTIFQISERQKQDIIPIRQLVTQSFETLTKLYQNREHLTGLGTVTSWRAGDVPLPSGIVVLAPVKLLLNGPTPLIFTQS